MTTLLSPQPRRSKLRTANPFNWQRLGQAFPARMGPVAPSLWTSKTAGDLEPSLALGYQVPRKRTSSADSKLILPDSGAWPRLFCGSNAKPTTRQAAKHARGITAACPVLQRGTREVCESACLDHKAAYCRGQVSPVESITSPRPICWRWFTCGQPQVCSQKKDPARSGPTGAAAGTHRGLTRGFPEPRATASETIFPRDTLLS